MIGTILAITLSGTITSPEPIVVNTPGDHILVKEGTTFESNESITISGYTVTFEGPATFNSDETRIEALDGIRFGPSAHPHVHLGSKFCGKHVSINGTKFTNVVIVNMDNTWTTYLLGPYFGHANPLATYELSDNIVPYTE